MSEVFIVDCLRTPVGKAPRGVFKNKLPDDLFGCVVKALKQKHAGIDWATTQDVIVGCAMPEAEQGMNVARIASLLAGLPVSVPAMTINRFCSSGVQTIATASQSLATAKGPAVSLAGGLESMSRVPMGGNKFTVNPAVFSDEHVSIAYGMGITAEMVAEKYGVTREQQDTFAVTSHERAVKALEQGCFQHEIVPVEVTQRGANLNSGEVQETTKTIGHDEGPRKDTSLDVIAKLRPVFSLKGTVTAGNTSQMSDGAGVALLANEEAIEAFGLTPRAKLLSFAVAGVEPEYMGIGPVKAIPKALSDAGLSLQDIDWIELNEAFAAQSLAVIETLDLPRDKVNPCGGAIALGHPLGATGAIRTATLLHGLERTGGRYGMVTMCIGTGMGAAAIFERI